MGAATEAASASASGSAVRATSELGLNVALRHHLHQAAYSVLLGLAIFPYLLLGRWLFFGYFLAYILYLVLRASDHDALDAFNLVMVVFAFPLTFTTLVVVSARELMRRREKG